MAHQEFKTAYFNDDPVATEIGRAMGTAHTRLVEQGLIEDFSIVYWAMCDVAWKASQEARHFA